MKKILFVLFAACLFTACDKEVMPVLGDISVTTDENNPEVITCTVDVVEGSVADGGFYYGTNKNSVSNGKATQLAGTYTGTAIQGEIKGLVPNTTYYIKAYAINEKGIANTEVVQVKTAARIPGAGDNQYPGTSK